MRMRYGYTPLICGVILAVFLVMTHQRNEVWRRPEALWLDITAKSPDKPRAWFGLATVYMQEYARTQLPLDREHAMAALIHADVLATKYKDLVISVPVETDMAILMIHAGDFEGAARILQPLVKANPGYDEAWAALATLHAKAGDPNEALSISAQLLEVNALWRMRASLYVARAEAYCRLGHLASADSNYAVARSFDKAIPAGHCQ